MYMPDSAIVCKSAARLAMVLKNVKKIFGAGKTANNISMSFS